MWTPKLILFVTKDSQCIINNTVEINQILNTYELQIETQITINQLLITYGVPHYPLYIR